MKESLGRRAGRLSCSLMGLYWFANVMSIAYANVYLLQRGLTNTMIGIVLAVSGALSILLQSVLAAWVDQSRKFSARHVLQGLFGSALVFSVAVEFVTSPWLVAILYVMMVGSIWSGVAFINAVILEYENSGYRVNYSISSAFGSLAYGIGAMVIGFLTNRYSLGILMPCLWANLVLCILVTVALPKIPMQRAVGDQGARKSHRGYLQLFQQHPKLLILLFAFFCLWISGISTNNYLIHVIYRVGGDVGDLGLVTSLGAWLEIPFMLLAGFLAKKHCRALLVFASFCYILKPLILLLAPNMVLVTIGQMMQGPSFAIFAVASVYFINHIVGEADLAKAQAVLNIATKGCSSLVANCVAGVILDYRGVNMLMMVCIGFTMTGFILISTTAARNYLKN